jgi:6-pyruvoyltetrahydropterin/6-carboxytetrahydropterin synthase
VFQLTRTVRFAVNAVPDDQLRHAPANNHGGYPSLTGAGQYFELSVTVEGPLQSHSSYLLNIKDIDRAVRDRALPLFDAAVRTGTFGGGAGTLVRAYDALGAIGPGARTVHLCLMLTPFLSLTVHSEESPMVRLSQKFEFSASHRLHNPALSPEENRATFGKCNNPQGHGHNYEVQVTLVGTPDANGVVIPVPEFERVVADTVIDRFDHKNLNAELPEFATTIPSVENIAKVIYTLLKPRFPGPSQLASVTVWETPKTWCEYSE